MHAAYSAGPPLPWVSPSAASSLPPTRCSSHLPLFTGSRSPPASRSLARIRPRLLDAARSRVLAYRVVVTLPLHGKNQGQRSSLFRSPTPTDHHQRYGRRSAHSLTDRHWGRLLCRPLDDRNSSPPQPRYHLARKITAHDYLPLERTQPALSYTSRSRADYRHLPLVHHRRRRCLTQVHVKLSG
jgi:hypothetical protein